MAPVPRPFSTTVYTVDITPKPSDNDKDSGGFDAAARYDAAQRNLVVQITNPNLHDGTVERTVAMPDPAAMGLREALQFTLNGKPFARVTGQEVRYAESKKVDLSSYIEHLVNFENFREFTQRKTPFSLHEFADEQEAIRKQLEKSIDHPGIGAVGAGAGGFGGAVGGLAAVAQAMGGAPLVPQLGIGNFGLAGQLAAPKTPNPEPPHPNGGKATKAR